MSKFKIIRSERIIDNHSIKIKTSDFLLNLADQKYAEEKAVKLNKTVKGNYQYIVQIQI